MKRIFYTFLLTLSFLALKSQTTVVFNGCNQISSNLFEASFEVSNVSDSADVLRFLIVDTSQIQVIYNDSIQNPNSAQNYLFENYYLGSPTHYSAIAYTETYLTNHTNIFYVFEFDCPSAPNGIRETPKEPDFRIFQGYGTIFIYTLSKLENDAIKIYDYFGNQYIMSEYWGQINSEFCSVFSPTISGVYIFYNPLSGTSIKVIYSEL